VTASRGGRAWRFVHPDFDDQEFPGASAGMQYDATGGIELTSDDASVRQSLLLLLSTSRGERVMRPEYGCDLRRLVFAANDDTTAGLAIHYVRQAVTSNEPRIDVLRIDATPGGDGDRLDISLEYRVRSSRSIHELRTSLDLTGTV
jgi:phage baseplate assembly protein W